MARGARVFPLILRAHAAARCVDRSPTYCPRLCDAGQAHSELFRRYPAFIPISFLTVAF
jgi:hypothetical protein